jgi:hypothetical protein
MLRRFSTAALFAAPLIVLVSLPAAEAQEPQRGETVTSRTRPELDPLGIRTGSFLFFPQLGVAARYDDNLFASDTGEIDDTITVVSPEFRLQSDWNNHALNFVAGAEAGFYADNSTEDYVDYFAGADTRLDVTRASQISASAMYSILHEARGDPEADDAALEPTDYSRLAAGVDYTHRFNRLSLGIGGLFDRYDYDDDVDKGTGFVINNDHRDRDEWQGSLRLGYEVSPGFELFARGTYFTVAYDVEADVPLGLDRDSTGYETVAGVAFDLSGVTFGEVFAGYRSQDPDDIMLETMKGPQFGGSLTWNPSGLTTVQAEIVRTVEETTQVASPGYFATRYGLGIDHELLRNLLLGLNGSLTTQDYEGSIDRNDDYVRGGLYAKYLMNRYLYVSFNYNYTDRRSNGVDAVGEYNKNVYMLRLQTQY